MKVSLKDIQQARETIKPYFHHTLLEHSANCSQMAGTDVYLKFENLQQTGSFKIRGAANKICGLSSEEKKRGVIAASAGNHAQGVACVAHKLDLKSVIVMPEQSPLIKILSTKRFGAQIILKGANYDEACEHAIALQKQHGYVFVHPFEDEAIIAGQGTLGLEIFEECPQAEVVFVPIGGGGLVAGVATALKGLNPKIRIVGVQAEGADGMARSFRSKRVVGGPSMTSGSTIAEGIAVKNPSAAMYSDFIAKLCDDVVVVDDDEIMRTIVFLMERAKTVVEGAGAAGLAALLTGKSGIHGRPAVAILSGGNIDLNILERIIDRGLQAAGRLAKILISAPDVPGTLNKLTQLIAEKKANILQINHNRVGEKLHLKEALIEFTLETTGQEHIDEIKKGLEVLGVRVLE